MTARKQGRRSLVYSKLPKCPSYSPAPNFVPAYSEGELSLQVTSTKEPMNQTQYGYSVTSQA